MSYVFIRSAQNCFHPFGRVVWGKRTPIYIRMSGPPIVFPVHMKVHMFPYTKNISFDYSADSFRKWLVNITLWTKRYLFYLISIFILFSNNSFEVYWSWNTIILLWLQLSINQQHLCLYYCRCYNFATILYRQTWTIFINFNDLYIFLLVI